jgi:hypothetical protein
LYLNGNYMNRSHNHLNGSYNGAGCGLVSENSGLEAEASAGRLRPGRYQTIVAAQFVVLE